MTIYVGEFNADDLRARKDKKAVDKVMQETGLKYTNTRLTPNGLKIWVCDIDDCDNFI